MQFVSQHTSIPVPRVICSFTHKGRTYIVMERIRGDMIGRGWVFRTAESKAKILFQLKEMVAEMRKIPPPPNLAVSNVDGGMLYDGRIYGPMQFGPFKSTQDFHRYLRGGLEAKPDNLDDLSKLIAWQDRPWSATVFTHGDLSSLNVFACGDEIVGIIDWETSGFLSIQQGFSPLLTLDKMQPMTATL